MPEPENTTTAVNLAILSERLAGVIKDVESLSKEKLNKIEFEPVRILVFGVTGLMLVAVVGAIIKLVIV